MQPGAIQSRSWSTAVREGQVEGHSWRWPPTPTLILLDEPLAGIDPINVGEIRELVSHFKDRGLGMLITDHNVRDTLDIIDRAYILHDGAVLREGPPAEIVADAAVRRVYLGERGSASRRHG